VAPTCPTPATTNGYEGRRHLSFILIWKLFSCGNSTLKGSQISGMRDASPGAWGVVYERGGQLFDLVPGQIFDRQAGGAGEPERVDQTLHAPLV
jgi:hypothetical protein